MSEVVPLPSFGEVFFDARGQDRVLRVTWHEGTLVLSLWRGEMCTASFRMPLEDVGRLLDTLDEGYAEAGGDELVQSGQHAMHPGDAPDEPGSGDYPGTGHYAHPGQYQGAYPSGEYADPARDGYSDPAVPYPDPAPRDGYPGAGRDGGGYPDPGPGPDGFPDSGRDAGYAARDGYPDPAAAEDFPAAGPGRDYPAPNPGRDGYPDPVGGRDGYPDPGTGRDAYPDPAGGRDGAYPDPGRNGYGERRRRGSDYPGAGYGETAPPPAEERAAPLGRNDVLVARGAPPDRLVAGPGGDAVPRENLIVGDALPYGNDPSYPPPGDTGYPPAGGPGFTPAGAPGLPGEPVYPPPADPGYQPPGDPGYPASQERRGRSKGGSRRSPGGPATDPYGFGAQEARDPDPQYGGPQAGFSSPDSYASTPDQGRTYGRQVPHPDPYGTTGYPPEAGARPVDPADPLGLGPQPAEDYYQSDPQMPRPYMNETMYATGERIRPEQGRDDRGHRSDW